MQSQIQKAYGLPPSSVYNSYPNHPPVFSEVRGREYVTQSSPYRSLDDFVSRDTRAFDKYINRDGAPASLLDLRSQRSLGVDYTNYANYLLEPTFGLSRISGMPQDFGIRPLLQPVGPSVLGQIQQTTRQPYAERTRDVVIRQLN